MTITQYQVATRYMATEVEHINRLLATRDISQAKAKLMLEEAASEAAKHTPGTFTIKFGVHQGKAWFNVL